MNRALSVFIALLCASLVPPAMYLVFSAWAPGIIKTDGLFELLFGVLWLVSLAHIIGLGLPIFFALARAKRLGWFSVSTLGFVVGSLPFAIFSYPTTQEGYSASANWHGKHVALYVNGEPTLFGWLNHAESSLAAG